jgi:hypothetical protein
MLSGIAGLKCKLVKNAGQRPRLLFTGAQKTANLASNLCTNSGENDPTPFTKVVEGWEVHNFGIHFLTHFSCKNSRKLGQRVLIRNVKPAGTPGVRRRPTPRRLTAVSAVRAP